MQKGYRRGGGQRAVGCHKGRQATKAFGDCVHDLQREEDKVRSRRAKVYPVRKVWQGVQIHNSVSFDLTKILYLMHWLSGEVIKPLADHVHFPFCAFIGFFAGAFQSPAFVTSYPMY